MRKRFAKLHISDNVGLAWYERFHKTSFAMFDAYLKQQHFSIEFLFCVSNPTDIRTCSRKFLSDMFGEVFIEQLKKLDTPNLSDT